MSSVTASPDRFRGYVIEGRTFPRFDWALAFAHTYARDAQRAVNIHRFDASRNPVCVAPLATVEPDGRFSGRLLSD